MEWLLNRRRFMARHAEEEWVDKGYLTFLAEEACTFSFRIYSNRTTEMITSVSYSLDNGKTWTTLTNDGSTTQTITTPIIKPGKRVIWKGIATTYDTEFNVARTSAFSSTGNFKAYGNVLSMILGDNFANTSLLPETWNLRNLFYRCYKVTDISGMVFPVATYASFHGMFCEATGLINAHTTMPMTNAEYCCCNMFAGCTNLVIGPELPATQLVNREYSDMFLNCSSLTTLSVLPALIVPAYTYYRMCKGCSSLSSVTMYATNVAATNAVGEMLSGVAATGTFYKNAAATWDNSKCVPSGWTVETVTV